MPWTTTPPFPYSDAPFTNLTVGGSPLTYQNASPYMQQVIVSGGTVSSISVSRDGTNFTALGLLSGCCVINPGDFCRIAYLTAPTVTVMNL